MLDYIPLRQLIEVFCMILIFGIALTLPFYKFAWLKYLHSKVFIKTIFWLPIFIIFVGLLYLGNLWRLVALLILAFAIAYEGYLVAKKLGQPIVIGVYLSCLSLALLSFIFIELSYPSEFIGLMITICLASVLSDVCAYFLGNYLGKHKLPPKLNQNKSWEGVFGQFIGAFIGVLIVNNFIIRVATGFIFLPIAVGNVIGDLSNSFVKRKLGIKDWSQALPGHGGFIDRLASLAGAGLLSFCFLKIHGL